MAIPFGWTDPKSVFGLASPKLEGASIEAYEDRLPFLPGMEREMVNAWRSVAEQFTRNGGDGFGKVVAAWNKHVVHRHEDPDLVLEALRKEADIQTQKVAEAAQAKYDAERRRVFGEEIEKVNAVSREELDAIDCPVETTRDLLMAAGYGGKWFTRDEMQRIHRVMAHRLEMLGMLETRAVYDESSMVINVAYRLKGT